MTIGIMGKKLGMTQAFDEDGRRMTLTVVEAGPCVVTQKKTVETDGYNALQVGFEQIDKRKANKPKLGHLAKIKGGPFRHLGEFRTDDVDSYKPGQKITLEIFKKGDYVDVVGRSKGKGFQGTIKRYGYSRGPVSHGSKNKRPPGSIGCSASPSRVFKGKKMPGHMGDRRVTLQNLRIWDAKPESNLLYVVGNVPGSRNGLLIIRHSAKGKRAGREDG